MVISNGKADPIAEMRKPGLVKLAMELASKKGTKADKDRSDGYWQSRTVAVLRDNITRLQARDAKGKVIHMADLVAGVACLAEKPSVAKLLSMPTTTEGDKVTCRGCRAAAGLDSDGCEVCGRENISVSAALGMDRVCDECIASESRPARDRRKRKAAPKITLEQVPEAGLACFYSYLGKRVGGLLFRDGTMRVGEEVHTSPSKAAKIVTGSEQNGWQRWKFDQDGAELQIGSLRGDKTKRTHKAKDPAAALAAKRAELVKVEARLQRTLSKRAELEATVRALEVQVENQATQSNQAEEVEAA